MKKIFFAILILPFLLSGCSENFTPMCATIKNQTLLSSPQVVLTVVYAEDKRVRDKFTDIWVKSDSPNFIFSFTKEMGNLQELGLENQNQWYSLSALLGKTPASFARVETTTYILYSNQDAKLTLKVVGGDLAEKIEINTSMLVNTFDVSEEVSVNFQQTTENT